MGRSRAVRRTVDVGCRCRICADSYLHVVIRKDKNGEPFCVTTHSRIVVMKSHETGENAVYLRVFIPDKYESDLSGCALSCEQRARFQRTGILFDARRKTRRRGTFPQRTNHGQNISGRHLHGREREDFSIQLSDGRHNCLPLQSCHTNYGRHSETQTGIENQR